MRMARMLRWARRRAGFTQRDLGERTGVPQSTIARIEAGAVDPRANTLRKLLRACDMDLEAVPTIGRGVDATLIREQLERTPHERLEEGAVAAASMRELRAAFQRSRR